MNRIRIQTMMVLAAALLCAGLASAQTATNLTIVSGNGQVVCPACTQAATFFYQPLVVMATDAFGNPVAGVPVNWTLVSPPSAGVFTESGANTYSTTTDATGRASTHFQINNFSLSGNSLFSYSQYSISAVSGSAAAAFTLTEGLQDPLNLSNPPVVGNAYKGTLILGQTFSGQVGTTSQTPIQIFVGDESAKGIQGVGIFLVDVQNNGATIECASSSGSSGNPAGVNVVLTDSTGVATCFPTFGGVPGNGLFYVVVGGSQSTDPTSPASAYETLPLAPFNPTTDVGSAYSYTVTPGAPGSISAVSGSGQSASPGQAVPQPLVVQVNNASGQPLSGVTVSWSVSPAGAATLSATTTTGSNGQASNLVTLTGSASGTVTVSATAAGSNSKATFSINAVPLVTITSFTIVSGNNQSAQIGTAFSQPLVVQVNSSAGPASGVSVHFQVAGGPISLSSANATTNSSGQAQITVQAGNAPGSASVIATITSSSGNSSQTFNLTVLPQGPTITASNFYNGADLQPGALSPCGLGALIPAGGVGVANVSPTFFGLPAPQTAISITFNSISAPVLNIGNTASGLQAVLFQVPCNLAPGSSIPVTVTIGGTTSNINLNVLPAAPGIFQTLQSDGVVRAVIVRPDGSFATAANPARRGETEIAYVTGLGATSPSVNTSALPVPGGTPATVLGTVIPGMAGGGATLVSAQLSPDQVGIYQVTFQIPSTESTGDVSFSIGIVPSGGGNPAYTALSKVPVQ